MSTARPARATSFNVFARGGRLIESRKVNRTATFIFAIGDHFFGTPTARVHQPYTARYDFTIALAVQLLKSRAPALEPLLVAGAGSMPATAHALAHPLPA